MKHASIKRSIGRYDNRRDTAERPWTCTSTINGTTYIDRSVEAGRWQFLSPLLSLMRGTRQMLVGPRRIAQVGHPGEED